MKSHKIFYGWWIVAVIFLISFYSSGIIFYSFTAVITPIVNEFGWSYAQVSFAASIRGFQTGIFAPLVGYVIDRFGPRKLIFSGGVIITIGLFLLSRINSITGLYAAFFLMALGLGACSGVILTTVIGNWFYKKVSIATGIAVCGSAFGGLLVPLVTYIVDVLEWRTAMMVFGAVALVWILPLSLLVRHKPEQYGYMPDGEATVQPVKTGVTDAPKTPEMNIKVRQALKSRAFWHISMGFMCHLMVVTSVLTHVMPYLSSIDIPRSTSSFVASGIPLISILGRLSFGWLGDKIDRRQLSALGFFITALGLLTLFFIDSLGDWLLVPFVIAFGFGFGGPVPVTPAMLLKYFGRARLGTVLGIAFGVMMIGMILGPPIAGMIFDVTGSYMGAWYLFTGILVLGIIGILTTPSVKQYHEKAVAADSGARAYSP